MDKAPTNDEIEKVALGIPFEMAIAVKILQRLKNNV